MRTAILFKPLVVFLALPAIMVLGACAAPASAPASHLTPEEVISRSQTTMSQLRAVRCETSSNATDNGRTTESSEQFEFVAPDRSHWVSTDGNVTSEMIAIGDTTYRRSAGSETWVALGSQFSPPQATITGVMNSFSSLIDLAELPDEKIDGTDCYHYKGAEDMKARAQQERARIAQLDPSDPHYAQLKESAEIAAQGYDNMTYTVQLWIGKTDYLLRELRVDEEGASMEQDTWVPEASTSITRYFDFNADITIEPPANVEGVDLVASGTSSIGGIDIQRQQVKYQITVTNMGTQTAGNVRVFVDTSATDQGLQTFEGVPAHAPATLAPGESDNYTVTWQVDLETLGKLKIADLMGQNVVRATWTGQDGAQKDTVLMQPTSTTNPGPDGQ